ncbi:MAG: hypothetical protein HC919_05900 [Oscillatoriales cyanobacterium SM2_2_1]|nr:hypothetical protein [Oscillatoriales cyanobacterium SM2_2_1]
MSLSQWLNLIYFSLSLLWLSIQLYRQLYRWFSQRYPQAALGRQAPWPNPTHPPSGVPDESSP